MNLPEVSIGGLCPKLPVIQGGMGIGISLSGLASAVANAGGIGIISGVQIGFREPDFEKDPVSANIRAIGKELRRARELAPNGIIGMNFMSIDSHYTEYVTEAVKQGADLIISGAGLPLTLPELTAGSQTRIVPIVSSARACRLILTKWLRKHNRFPDAVVVEGPLAGGHLGFKLDDLYNGTNQTLEQALADVVAYIRKFEQEHNVSIPVFAAGGIMDYTDVQRMLEIGASGVQVGSSFVTTKECDASDRFKQTYLDARPEDVHQKPNRLCCPCRQYDVRSAGLRPRRYSGTALLPLYAGDLQCSDYPILSVSGAVRRSTRRKYGRIGVLRRPRRRTA